MRTSGTPFPFRSPGPATSTPKEYVPAGVFHVKRVDPFDPDKSRTWPSPTGRKFVPGAPTIKSGAPSTSTSPAEATA
jgi:hypothetical protein